MLSPLGQQMYFPQFYLCYWNEVPMFRVLCEFRPTNGKSIRKKSYETIWLYDWVSFANRSFEYETWKVPFDMRSIALSFSSTVFKFCRKWKLVSLILFNWLLLKSSSCREVNVRSDCIGNDVNALPSPCDIFNDVNECPICRKNCQHSICGQMPKLTINWKYCNKLPQ